jgi:hypothetical protein
VTAKEARQLYERAGQPVPHDLPQWQESKFRNRRFRDPEGQSWDSQLEYRAWGLLRLWEAAGAIRELRRQVSFPLAAGIVYRADFAYYGANGKQVVVEAKGFWSPTAKLKWRMFRAAYPEIHAEVWTKDTLRELGA